MDKTKASNLISWVLVVLLALGFLLASLGKLTGAQTQMFEQWGYPSWFAYIIGIAELAGAIGLLIPKFTKFAILGLTLIMIGAAFTHLANGESMQIIRPAIFAILLWGVWLLRKYSFPRKI
ncbi:MAG: DoxX family protein [Pyrinomonadaceae bacterium]